jgi:hypothetical protein
VVAAVAHVKTIWIVRWRGIEERCASLADAVDRWEQLDPQGIDAEVFELVDGQHRPISL